LQASFVARYLSSQWRYRSCSTAGRL